MVIEDRQLSTVFLKDGIGGQIVTPIRRNMLEPVKTVKETTPPFNNLTATYILCRPQKHLFDT